MAMATIIVCQNLKCKQMRKTKSLTLIDLGNNPDMLLTTGQVKQVLGVSDPTLYRWRKLHLIPCFKVGGVFKYKSSEIINFLKNNEI